ncbi:hypothetical protein [Nocardia xishanensis]
MATRAGRRVAARRTWKVAIRGRSFCFVDAVHVGGPDELATLLAPVRRAGTVLRETVRPLRLSEIGTLCEEPC